MKTLAILAAAAAALATVPATAQEAQVAVRYGDIDIASPAGAAQLGNRVEAGVKAVCGRPDIRDLPASAAWKDCKDAAVAGANEQLASKGVQVALAD